MTPVCFASAVPIAHREKNIMPAQASKPVKIQKLRKYLDGWTSLPEVGTTNHQPLSTIVTAPQIHKLELFLRQ
ncbi:hypothetical protein [Acidocella sp. C78]|uniref:hypothetical protein n=1 Tax=Acidocella sp. C78 TaxID=1671486 RepID=UPI00191B8FD6|nr:hypothetical protein [Acidocella sp. C78]